MKFVRFEKINIHDYGVFSGQHEFIFNPQQTLIEGGHSSGKTTIINALASFGPAPGVKPNLCADLPNMSVTVTTNGDRELIDQFGSIIFFDGESLFDRGYGFEGAALAGIRLNTIKGEVSDIFEAMLRRKLWKTEEAKELYSGMTAGSRFCLGLAIVFAVRNSLGLELPLVIDSPYGPLDNNLRARVRDFLGKQACQQILLCSPSQIDGGEVDYTLDSLQ